MKMNILSSCKKLINHYIQIGTKVMDSCHPNPNPNPNHNPNPNPNHNPNYNRNHSHFHLRDDLLWHKDIAKKGSELSSGDNVGFISMAVVQANASLEDQCQVKIGKSGTFVGIYDGHGGPDASRFISKRLFPKIEFFTRESGGGVISSKVLKQAFGAIEEEFVALVHKHGRSKPRMMSVGSCCLVGAIYGNHLYIANLGDSRVVLGTEKQNDGMVAVRLSQEHNASYAEVRDELKAQHPDDSDIVTLKHGVWRVKGIIQVSRSIGDVYLKRPYSDIDSLLGSNVCCEKGVLSAKPSVHERLLSSADRFLIFASDGLWDVMTDQEAVDIVQKGPSNGIAKRLVTIALKKAAKNKELHYADLIPIRPGARRSFHDDISVVVVYLGNNTRHTTYSRSISKERVSLRVSAPPDIFSSGNLDNVPLINVTRMCG